MEFIPDATEVEKQFAEMLVSNCKSILIGGVCVDVRNARKKEDRVRM